MLAAKQYHNNAPKTDVQVFHLKFKKMKHNVNYAVSSQSYIHLAKYILKAKLQNCRYRRIFHK